MPRSDPRRRLLTLARHRAKRDGLPFSLSLGDITIPEDCPVLGIPLSNGPGRPHDGSPTLDRIDPERGYVPGNVWVISSRANRAKNNLTLTELLRLVACLQQMKQ